MTAFTVPVTAQTAIASAVTAVVLLTPEGVDAAAKRLADYRPPGS